ncbi:MAG: hypothetical protein WBO10_14895 [Pyrinomonadaceae bacterium]
MSNSTSSIADFDFAIGDWIVKHRRLKDRLVGCDEWVEFDGTMSTRKILGGAGNLEDNFLDLPGDPYRAIALRSFNAKDSQWSIWWLDGRNPTNLDVPVLGGFADGTGLFFAKDQLDGQPIVVRFTWIVSDENPRWEQAFSNDEGSTWETNWTMDFQRGAI